MSEKNNKKMAKPLIDLKKMLSKKHMTTSINRDQTIFGLKKKK